MADIFNCGVYFTATIVATMNGELKIAYSGEIGTKQTFSYYFSLAY